METYRAKHLDDVGITSSFVQDNHSGSRQGILRGLHYQIRHTQGKLVRAIVGEIFDVAVDLRRSSDTFGLWVGEVLSSENRRLLWVPEGFAHGFYVLSEWAEVIYKVTDYYDADSELTLIWNDPSVGIVWPLTDGRRPLLSDKDANGSRLDDAQTFS
jgi:dTDP-4-dehydrorhamnose 3,5-epimerase